MKSRIFWGIVLILLAAALILNICGIEFGLPDGIENRQLILGALCLFWIIRCFIDKKFNHLFFPVAFIVMIFEQEIALALHIASGDLAPWWMLFLIAMLLSGGCSLLFSRSKDKVVINGDGVRIHHGKRVGTSMTYIDCSEKFSEHVENNLGSCVIRFSNAELFVDGSELILENNLGSIVVHVPEGVRVKSDLDNTLGSVKLAEELGTVGDKTLYVHGDNNLGSIVIRRG